MKKYSNLEKILLFHADPVNFSLNVIGIIFFILFLWGHSFWYFILSLIVAVIVVFYILGAGGFKSKRYEDKRLTKFEKHLLGYARPVNGTLHIFAIIVGILSLWKHSPSGIIIALIVMLIGHLYEWLMGKGKNRGK